MRPSAIARVAVPAALLFSFLPASARTIHVPAEEPTIGAGVAAASPGDTVQVACGTYLEHDILLSPGVILRSATGAADCVTIDAQGQGRALYAMAISGGAEIRGFTFTGGFNDRGHDFDDNDRRGAPESPESGLDPLERDVGGGGAVYSVLSFLRFEDCRFLSNDASFQGGAVRCEGGSALFTRCDFDSNTAGNQGGALYAGSRAEVEVLECRFDANDARQGGAMFASHLDSLSVVRTDFVFNATDGAGGAVQLGPSPFTRGRFDECVFFENRADRRGGAIAALGARFDATSCTFVRNTAPDGAAIAAVSASVTVEESIVAFNLWGEPVTCASVTPTFACTDVFGNQGGDFAGCLAGLDGVLGNFSDDPLFCDLFGGDLELSVASPCLAAGNPCAVLIGAEGPGACGPASGLLVVTNPPNLTIEVDGVEYGGPAFFDFEPGTIHTVSTTTPQQSGASIRRHFVSWSDGGEISHTIVAPLGFEVLTATFDSEYFVTITTTGTGTVTPPSGWFDEGTEVAIEATPAEDWLFATWQGVGEGSYSGSDNPSTITVNGPITETAVFTFGGDYLLTMNAWSGGSVTPPTGSQPAGSTVAIEAFPDPGFAFLDWIGSGSGSFTGTDNPGTVTMNGDITQIARFTQILHPVTMVAESGGTVVPSPGVHLRPEGSPVTITAIPDPGFSFAGWTGSGSGSYTGPDNPSSITVNGPIVQVAHFEAPDDFPLTMTQSGEGIVTPPSGSFPSFSEVEIEAIPAPGWSFLRWVGTGQGSYTGFDSLATVTMLGAITQEAEFRLEGMRLLTMNALEGGTVIPATGQYPFGSAVTIRAIPDAGWAFDRWVGLGQGSYSGFDNPSEVTMLGDVTETAVFTPSVNVTFATDPTGLPVTVDGTAYVSPVTLGLAEGTPHTVAVDSLIASGEERDRFSIWNDGVTTAARSIVVPGSPVTFTASYEHELHLRFENPPEGTSLPGNSWHPVGAIVVIEAVANPSFQFLGWSGVGDGSFTGTQNPASVTMNEPLVQSPSFGPFGYEFSISASSTDPFENVGAPTGALRGLHLWVTCAEEGIAAFEAGVTGSLVPLAFTPAPNVLNIGGATDLLLAIGGCPIGDEVGFRLGRFDVIDDGGTLCLGPHPGKDRISAVDCDQQTPSLVEDPRVVGYASDGTAPCMVGERACFTGDPEEFFVSIVPLAGGTVSPTSRFFPAGTMLTVQAFPNPGFSFVAWEGTGDGSYTGTDNPALITVNGPLTQVASFTPIIHPVTMLANGSGTVTPPSGEFAEGTVVQIEAVPDAGWMFSGWSGTGSGSYSGSDNPASITVGGPITQTANFTQPEVFPLVMLTSGNGTVTPNGGSVPNGAELAIEATPAAGESFLFWEGTGPGSYTGSDAAATITMNGPITQHAFFTEASPTVDVTIATSPAGLAAIVDGDSVLTPVTRAWAPGSQHSVVVDSLVAAGAGARNRFAGWDDGHPFPARTITSPLVDSTFTAVYEPEYFLDFVDPPEGSSLPGDSWRSPGELVEIEAVAAAGFAFDEWIGIGDGSYSGPDNPVTITMDEPLTQAPSFVAVTNGYEFTISASSTDPHVSTDAPTGGLRELHLWVTCADAGISAFEGSAAGSLVPVGFVPAENIFNVGGAVDLLLAVGGCPTGAAIDFRLGHWLVSDAGGALCLAPSPGGILGAVDCAPNPALTVSPGVTGFASDGTSPCSEGENGCSPGAAQPTETGDGAATRNAIERFVTIRPNPFARETGIVLGLTREAHARVAIYDVRGRLVRRLLDGVLAPGAHTVRWRAVDSRGIRVPAGVYFLRAEAGPERATRKLVVIPAR